MPLPACETAQVVSLNFMLRRKSALLQPHDLFVHHTLKLHNAGMGEVDGWRFMYLPDNCA